MKNLAIILLVSFSMATSGDGLECYVCTSSDVSWNEDCETGNTTLLSSIVCPESMQYCTYTKTQWNSINGANSVLRSCANEPLYRNGQQDLQDGNLTVWYRSCGLDLCNDARNLSKDQAFVVLTTIFSLLLASIL